MNEQEMMADRLMHGPVRADGTRRRGYKLINFNATWGDGDPEARAGAVNRVLGQLDAGELQCLPPDALGR